jgi:hypothetical protein
MSKIYDGKMKKYRFVNDGLVCAVEDAWFEVSDILAENRLDGHDEYDQWLMKLGDRLGLLLDVLQEGTDVDAALDSLLGGSKFVF